MNRQKNGGERKRDLSMWWERAEMGALQDARSRMVAFYCFRGPQSVGPGLFRLSVQAAREHLKMDEETWTLCFWEVLEAFGWRWDEQQQVLWITDWFDWHEIRNRRELHELLNPLRKLPETDWYFEFQQHPPQSLAAKLLDAWRSWFCPIAQTPPAKPQHQKRFAPLKLDELSELQPADIPQVVDRALHPRTHYLIKQCFDQFLHFSLSHPEAVSSTSPLPPPLMPSGPVPSPSPLFSSFEPATV